MTKKIIFTLALILCISSQSLWAQSVNSEADKIKGTWTSESGDRKFQIYKTENNYYQAKVSWVRNSSNSKDIGHVVIKHLIFEKGKYTGGEVYAPANGEWVKCRATLKDDHTLVVTGSKGMFSKSQTWSR